MESRLSKKAHKYYDKAPKNLQEYFDSCIKDIEEGRGDITLLKPHKDIFRYKTYHYRFIFQIDTERNEILISEIGPRGDIYK